LCFVLQPLTFGPMQLRMSEALTMLPFIMTEGIVGIVVGCLIVNFFSPFMMYDVIFGTLATLTAGILTYKIKNKWLAGLPPILVNALVLPLMWHFLGTPELYIINLLSITLSQSIVVYAVGIPMVTALQKNIPSLVSNPNITKRQTNYTDSLK
ncbi:MAG: QueT transporter family protein, partial [Clostridia bacterium]